MSSLEQNLILPNQFSKQLLSSKTQPDQITTEVLTTTTQFHGLENEWDLLLRNSSCDSIFLSWEWVSTWWKYFQDSTKLWIIIARQAETNQLVGIAPLIIKKKRGITGLNNQTLVFIGDGSAAPDHLDFIIQNGYENNVNQLFSKKIWEDRHNWDQIKIEGLVSTSTILYLLLQEHPRLLNKIDKTICPYLTLPNNWETLKKSLSNNMRYNLGRFKRRLEKDYPDVITFSKITETDEIEEFMSVLVNLHTSSQKRKNNTGIFSDQRMIDFHSELADIFLRKGWLRSYSLDVGKISIAALHCFQYNGTVSFYQSGFDPSWHRYSPGSQIMAHAIREAITDGNRTFDFLRGDEDYKFNWARASATNLNFTIPLSFQNQFRLEFKRFSRKLFTRFR